MLCTTILVRALYKSSSSPHPDGKASTIIIQACFFNYTFDSIMSIFFGEDSHTAEGVPNQYGKAS